MSEERDLLRKLFDAGMLDRLLAIEVGQLLAQPETNQEPVAWQLSSKDSSYTELRKAEPEGADMYLYQIKPLYKSPRTRNPLSVDKILTLSKCHTDRLNFARAIENEHGI